MKTTPLTEISRPRHGDALPLGASQECAHLTEKLKLLENENLESVVRFLVFRENLDESEVRKMRLEFLRFISLVFMTQDEIVPTPKVDKFWHAFILHTKQYTEFCQKHLGFYLHHQPSDHWWSSSERRPITETTITAGADKATKELVARVYPGYDRAIWQEAFPG